MTQNVSDLKKLVKLACDGLGDGEQIAESGGKNYFLDFSVASSFASEVLANIPAFPNAIPEAKALNADGLDQLLVELQADFPTLGNAKLQLVLSSIVNAVKALEPLFNQASAPTTPIAPTSIASVAAASAASPA